MQNTERVAQARAFAASLAQPAERYAKCRTNADFLAACPKHNFHEMDPKEFKTQTSYRCHNCGGVIQHQEFLWYKRGVTDALLI